MADTAVYRLIRDGQTQRLKLLGRTTMSEQGFTEPRDLETWLASSGKELLGREILWIARQDWVTGDQRSDLIGIERGSGDLVVTELKRGTADEGAITQALVYAAEYAELDYDGLLERFRNHSGKLDGLLDTPPSNAEARLKEAIGDNEAGEYHIVLVVAEEFSDRALALANYLNNNSGGDASFGLELWRYGLRSDSDGDRIYFVLEQVLPPFNTREEIERKRDAAKAHRRPRDQSRMKLLGESLEFLRGEGYAVDKHWKQYSFGIRANDWPEGTEVKLSFERWQDAPVLTIPSDFGTWQPPEGIEVKGLPDGVREVTLPVVGPGGVTLLEDVKKLLLLILSGTAAPGSASAG